MHAGTEAFVAAVQAAGSDPVRMSEVLHSYVPEPPTSDADDLILGPKGTGRTAELFASHASPLSALACISAELRRASDLGDVAPLALPIQEVLAAPDLRAHLVCMPRLALTQSLDTTRYLEALWQCLAQDYRGITSVHAPLLETYMRAGQTTLAQQLCDATDVDATDNNGCLAQSSDVAEYMGVAGAMYASAGSYAAAEELWDTTLAIPCGAVHPAQTRVFPQALCVKLLRHGQVPPLSEMMPLTSASMRAYFVSEYEAWISYVRAYEYATSWRGMLAASTPTPPADLDNEGPLARTLCEACQAYLPRHRLCTLARLFSTLPLTQVASYVGYTEEETCALVQAMTEQGTVHAYVRAWDPASIAQGVPLPGPLVPQAPMLVHFTAPSPAAELAALHSTLAGAVMAEQAAAPRLEQEHHAQLLSHTVLSKILALHTGVPHDSGDLGDSAAELDLDAPDEAPPL
ncbi:hypothetical protein MCAP1_002876 [Malassezia caprae]|uniref:COP9 signalosome complex subunit 3 n=1 Tax=Malassezia caprae TaxID=1381934 RepID=A0AAF0EDM3_9BASI|nr:hypothetical protein MCAP1_002876 [Malassezia caprae]